MGVLVTGALKVEEGLERLKRNARSISGATKTKANAKLRPTWTQVRNSLKRSHANPIMRRIEPLPNQLEHDARVLVKRAKFRTSMQLTGLIDRTIVELEKVKRRLGRDSPTGWSAA